MSPIYLFYVGGMSVAVLLLPTALVLLAARDAIADKIARRRTT